MPTWRSQTNVWGRLLQVAANARQQVVDLLRERQDAGARPTEAQARDDDPAAPCLAVTDGHLITRLPDTERLRSHHDATSGSLTE